MDIFLSTADYLRQSFSHYCTLAAILVFSLLVAFAAPSTSVVQLSEEVTIEYENIEEFLSTSRSNRVRRLGKAKCQHAVKKRQNILVSTGNHELCHLFYAGHRLQNGLLAPLKC